MRESESVMKPSLEITEERTIWKQEACSWEKLYMIFKQNVHTTCKMNTITKCEHGGCDPKYDIEGKKNGVRKHGGCDLKHDITYILRKREMEFVSVEDVIQNTISLTG